MSGVTNGDEGKDNGFTEDDLFDEYSFAVKYTSPLGFQIGAGYEVDVMHDERFTGAGSANYDDRSGWRVGARYGQNNWLLAYEYRSYDSFNVFDNLNVGDYQEVRTYSLTMTINATAGLNLTQLTVGIGGWFNDEQVAAIEAIPSTFADNTTFAAFYNNRGTSFASLFPTNNLRPNTVTNTDWYRKLSYEVHRVGMQVKFDRITASAGYSLATQKLDLAGAVDLDETALAVDAAYHLGLNSLIAVGWKKVKKESWATGGVNSNYDALNTALDNASLISRTQQEATETTTQLYYRVDF